MALRHDRFYKVVRGYGKGGARAKAFYIQYLQGLTAAPDPSETVNPRGARKLLYVDPFAFNLGATDTIEESAIDTAWQALGQNAAVAARVKTAPGTDTPITALRSYAAPRVVRKVASGVTVARSKFTNEPYKKPNTNSQSIPFGEGPDTETVQAAYTAIVTALKGGAAVPRGTTYTLIPERV